MDKNNAKATQDMWKDNPNVQAWLDTITHPLDHIEIVAELRNKDRATIKSCAFDGEYHRAIEGLAHLLGGKVECPKGPKNSQTAIHIV